MCAQGALNLVRPGWVALFFAGCAGAKFAHPPTLAERRPKARDGLRKAREVFDPPTVSSKRHD